MMMRSRRLLLLIMMGVLLSACTLRRAPLPTPLPTATIDRRPTLPPTYTPSPTITTLPDVLDFPTFTATITLSATPTEAVFPTPTSTQTLTVTPTWTPDLSTWTPGGPGGTATPVVNIGPECYGNPTGENLLKNSNFEAASYHQDGDSALAVPESWIGFWLAEGTPINYDPENKDGYRRPDMQVINTDPPFDNPPRVLQGRQAFRLFADNRVFDGGIYQRVEVTPGKIYCLSGYAHAWSNHGSNERGRSKLDTGDDRRNANFLLGLDPTGNTVPWASTVFWGATAHLYDKYQPIPSIQIKAADETLTVFVRGYNLWRFDHNDFFFDNLSLVELE